MVILDGEEFLTVEEAAKLLGVKPATLYAYVSRGIVKSYRQGIKRQRLYRRAEVEALIRLDRGDGLAVHPSGDGRVVTLEYEVHGRILKSGVAYENRFVSIAFIENRKIVHWRDYMDSLAAWTALTSAS